MAHIVHGAHFGLSLFPKVHFVRLDLHIAASCNTHMYADASLCSHRQPVVLMY